MRRKELLIVMTLVFLSTIFVFSKEIEATPYAVLINGGNTASSNNIAFWNDLSAIYTTLVGTHGYLEENIFVLNSDGAR